VATFAIGEAGAANAALHVIAILAAHNADLMTALEGFRSKQTAVAQAMELAAK
jgi:5-(carboxyamino)imidazole ribonucleotide mutase